jgi:hypothetical protein
MPQLTPVTPKPAVLDNGALVDPTFARLQRLWQSVNDMGHDDAVAGRSRKKLTGEKADFQRDYDGAYDDALSFLQESS